MDLVDGAVNLDSLEKVAVVAVAGGDSSRLKSLLGDGVNPAKGADQALGDGVANLNLERAVGAEVDLDGVNLNSPEKGVEEMADGDSLKSPHQEEVGSIYIFMRFRKSQKEVKSKLDLTP